MSQPNDPFKSDFSRSDTHMEKEISALVLKGELVFVSGHSQPQKEHTQGGFRDQVKRAIDYLQAYLKSHHLALDNVINISILIENWDAIKLCVCHEEISKLYEHNGVPDITHIPLTQANLITGPISLNAIALK
ncbi:MAG: Rid family hydrolase [Marinomonas sp.]